MKFRATFVLVLVLATAVIAAQPVIHVQADGSTDFNLGPIANLQSVVFSAAGTAVDNVFDCGGTPATGPLALRLSFEDTGYSGLPGVASAFFPGEFAWQYSFDLAAYDWSFLTDDGVARIRCEILPQGHMTDCVLQTAGSLDLETGQAQLQLIYDEQTPGDETTWTALKALYR